MRLTSVNDMHMYINKKYTLNKSLKGKLGAYHAGKLIMKELGPCIGMKN